MTVNQTLRYVATYALKVTVALLQEVERSILSCELKVTADFIYSTAQLQGNEGSLVACESLISHSQVALKLHESSAQLIHKLHTSHLSLISLEQLLNRLIVINLS